MMDKFEKKYTWTSVEFDRWVKKQSENLRREGAEVGSATITHKLLHEFIIPNNINIEPPKIRGNLKCKKRGIY